MMQRTAVFLAVCAALAGCDFLSKAQGVMKAAEQLGKHLEKDLKAPLTDAKITRVLELTPELQEFTKQAEHKWRPDPQSGDVAELTAAMGAISEYMAFFEARDTRITTYYADLLKIHDAYSQIAWRRARADALEELAAERADLEARRDAGELQPAEAERLLRQNTKARQHLEQASLQDRRSADAGQQQGQPPYTLSDEEIGLVEARFDEIQAALRDADYVQETPKPEAVR